MNENFDAFDEYAMQFDMNEEKIAYKYNHTYRVVHQAEEISRSINLEEEDKDIASLIALLHDIARFKQWTMYKTYSDYKSFDHGDEAVKLLYDEGLIHKFVLNHEYDSVIKKAIYYHNKLEVDETDMTIKEKLHSKIIRDADKLDILYAFSTGKLLHIEEDESEISDAVRDTFMLHKAVDMKDCKSKNDEVILLLAEAFDFNYKYSKNRIYDEDYMNKIYNNLEHKSIFKEYIDEINNYLKGDN